MFYPLNYRGENNSKVKNQKSKQKTLELWLALLTFEFWFLTFHLYFNEILPKSKKLTNFLKLVSDRWQGHFIKRPSLESPAWTIPQSRQTCSLPVSTISPSQPLQGHFFPVFLPFIFFCKLTPLFSVLDLKLQIYKVNCRLKPNTIFLYYITSTFFVKKVRYCVRSYLTLHYHEGYDTQCTNTHRHGTPEVVESPFKWRSDHQRTE